MKCHPCFQRGMALVMLLLTLLLGAGSTVWMRSAMERNSGTIASDRLARIHRLAQARQALLSYSTAYADNYLPTGAGPGHLPCPDRSPINDGHDGNDGPDPPCRRVGSNTGRFPRFTYSRDRAGDTVGQKRIEFYPEQSLLDQQMWYVVSRSHINNPLNTVVNPSTRGQLHVDSQTSVAAVIIEPGRDLETGNAQRPGDTITAYLEGENADGDSRFSQRDNKDGNDLLVFITAAELMQVTRSRVTLKVLRWIRNFAGRNCASPGLDCYPAAGSAQGECQVGLESGFLPLHKGTCKDSLASMGQLEGVEPARHWFVRNGWLDYYRYQLDPRCIGQRGNGCEPRISKQADPLKAIQIIVAPPESDEDSVSARSGKHG